jgi:hypothetical protein
LIFKNEKARIKKNKAKKGLAFGPLFLAHSAALLSLSPNLILCFADIQAQGGYLLFAVCCSLFAPRGKLIELIDVRSPMK